MFAGRSIMRRLITRPPLGNYVSVKENKILTVKLNTAIDQTLFIPAFRGGEVNRVQRSYLHVGGKGVNVASLLADYDFSISATGFLGADNTIKHCLRALEIF